MKVLGVIMLIALFGGIFATLVKDPRLGFKKALIIYGMAWGLGAWVLLAVYLIVQG